MPPGWGVLNKGIGLSTGKALGLGRGGCGSSLEEVTEFRGGRADLGQCP